MENPENKVIHDRLNGLEKRVGAVDKKVDVMDDKLEAVDQKHSDRHLEQIKVTTELQGTSRMTMEATNRMANSIEGLVTELKQSSSRTDTRFAKVDEDVSSIKSKVESQEEAKKLKLEEKKLSNGVVIAIVGGGFVVVQSIVQFIAPLLFGG